MIALPSPPVSAIVTADRAGRSPRQALGPFDGHDSARGQIGIESDLVELGAIEAIEIDVHQRQPSAAVFVHERERRAGDFVWVDAQALGEASHEGGLAGPEIARQQDDGAGGQVLGEPVRDDAFRLPRS